MNEKEALSLELMGVIKRLKRGGFRQEGSCSLTPGQTALLHLVYAKGGRLEEGVPVSSLVEQTGLTSSGIAQGLGVLERRGYIRRSHDSRDRRVIRVHLLPQGEESMAAHHRKILSFTTELIDAVGTEKIRTFIDIMEEMIRFKEERDHDA